MTRRRLRLIGIVALVALVALAGCSGASNGDAGGGDGARGGDAASAGGGGAGGAGGGTVGSFYAEDGERVIVREADMRLRVDNFTRSFRGAREIAVRYGGYVGERSMDARGDWQEGTLTVRVPAENFTDARDDLAALGHVENENVDVRDFTDEYREQESRIEQLRQEERELERLLNETSDPEEAERLHHELREVRGQLRDLQSDQQSIERREALSTIRLSMHEPVNEQPPRNYRSAFGFEDAFLQAFYGGLTVVQYVIVFFGYAIPIGLAMLPLGAFGIGLVLGFRRIRRVVESILGTDSAGNPQVRDAPVVADESHGEDEADADED